MLELLKVFATDQSGQDLSEYALLLVLIAAALIGVLVLLRDQIKAAFQNLTNALQTANTQAS